MQPLLSSSSRSWRPVMEQRPGVRGGPKAARCASRPAGGGRESGTRGRCRRTRRRELAATATILARSSVASSPGLLYIGDSSFASPPLVFLSREWKEGKGSDRGAAAAVWFWSSFVQGSLAVPTG